MQTKAINKMYKDAVDLCGFTINRTGQVGNFNFGSAYALGKVLNLSDKAINSDIDEAIKKLFL